jgi:hypothetical protein
MLSVTRGSGLAETLVEVAVCVVCTTPVQLGHGYRVTYLDGIAFIGCLACLASFQGDPARHLDRPCPDCMALECPDSPVSEWACY